MTNHPNRRNVYTIKAMVARANGQKLIEWEYEGKGSGTDAWRAWRHMKATRSTVDTQEKFHSASILRNGEWVEAIG